MEKENEKNEGRLDATDNAENTEKKGKNKGTETHDVKECFALNLIKYRKSANLTQAELAEKLNYSDKAVSKWERAESVPDIYTIKNVADFFGVKVDVLISEPKYDRPKVNYNLGKKRTILCLASAAIVWLVAVLFYFFIHLFVDIKIPWLSFVYAIPVTAIVLLIFTSVWGKSLGNVIILSVLIWSVIATVYITLLLTLDPPPAMLWEIFLIGIPAQAATLFWFLYVKVK